MRLRVVSSLLPLCTLLSTLSCRDLERFDTHGNGAYCGELVRGPSFTDGFIDGEPSPPLRMRLTLDTSQLSALSGKASSPGRLTSNDAQNGLCSAQGQALFSDSKLRGIPQVDHDAIGAMTFGDGHDEDFFAWVDSRCQGTMLSVVSLLRNGDVELRLFKPALSPRAEAPVSERPGFALFYLRRSEQGCDFPEGSSD
jgi:hypothetical protein